MELTVASDEDSALCASLIQIFYAQEPGMSPLSSQDAQVKSADILAAAQQQRAYFLLLHHQGATVGYALIVPYFSSEYGGMVALLDELLILPEFQSQGLGSLALAETKNWCSKQNLKRVLLEVTDENLRVTRFYERNGFRVLPRLVMLWHYEDTVGQL